MEPSRKLTLYLMTRKGLGTLRAILAECGSACVAQVIAARDEAVLDDAADAIRDLAEAHRIAFAWRSEARVLDPAAVGLAVGWRWMIPGIHDLLVFHDSLLPRYRGFNPLVSALVNGDPELGVTALWAAESYDVGPIVARRRAPIRYPITIAQAVDAVVPLYEELARELASRIGRGERPAGSPQPEAEATYSLWRDEDDYRIDWGCDAERIRRFIDAVGFPYRGASSYVGRDKVRILRATPLPDVRVENRTPGKVIFVRDGLPEVVCGKGLLRIDELVSEPDRRNLLPIGRFRVRFLSAPAVPE